MPGLMHLNVANFACLRSFCAPIEIAKSRDKRLDTQPIGIQAQTIEEKRMHL